VLGFASVLGVQGTVGEFPLAGGYGLVETALNSVPPPGCESTMLDGVTLPLKVKKTVPVAPGVPTGVAPRFAAPSW
jgi:hypothetical protein